ncbi:MAG: hypothetical protein KF832_02565 [Caldilineaceae bacterium]|nr:hypothetical protein [Caldilineaceae bacterium]
MLLAFLSTSGCAWWLLPPVALPAITLSSPLSNATHPVTEIPLDGPLALPMAELSGLSWYGDSLILLPQYPSRFQNQLFGLHKQEIIDVLTGRTTAPLRPFAIPFLDEGVTNQIAGFNGFEAITFIDDQIYLTIEAVQFTDTMGYLVSGTVAPNLSEIRLDPTRLTAIPAQTDLVNLSDEAIVAVGDQLATIYEANGLFVNPAPTVHFFDRFGLNQVGMLPLTPIEYRITDATAIDNSGRFWVINYFYPGDRALQPILRSRGAEGAIDETAKPIERLLELQFTTEGVVRTATPPLQLTLLDDHVARNWEGIVRLQTDEVTGFLLVTDMFPQTILAFVSSAE